MEKIAFDLVSDEKKLKFDISVSEWFFFIGLGGFLLLILVGLLSKNYFYWNLEDSSIMTYLTFGFGISFIIGLAYGFFDYNGNNIIIDGFITFDKNEITINHARRYLLTEIDRLKFEINDYRGRAINLPSDGDPNNSYGGDNYVEFEHENIQYKFQFIAKSERHLTLLTKELFPLMRAKVNIIY